MWLREDVESWSLVDREPEARRETGDALRRVAADQDVAQALFDVLEVQRIGESEAKVTLIPRDNLLAQLVTSR